MDYLSSFTSSQWCLASNLELDGTTPSSSIPSPWCLLWFRYFWLVFFAFLFVCFCFLKTGSVYVAQVDPTHRLRSSSHLRSPSAGTAGVWYRIWLAELLKFCQKRKNIILPKVCALVWGRSSTEKGKTSPFVKPYFGPVKVAVLMFAGQPKGVSISQTKGWTQTGTQASSLNLSISATL